MTDNTMISPISGRSVSKKEVMPKVVLHESFGPWVVDHILLKNGFQPENYYSDRGFELTQKESLAAYALFRTKIWQCEKLKKPKPYLLESYAIKSLEDYRQLQGVGPVTPITMKQLHQEAETLNLESKALLTLYNLTLAETAMGKGIKIPFCYVPTNIVYSRKPPLPDQTEGMAAGCSPEEAAIIFLFLKDRGLARIEKISTANSDYSHIFITPDGYIMADKIRSGTALASEGFCVCKFDYSIVERAYNKIYKEVGSELNCPIKRIKDEAHLEKIDDRILIKIRSAALILVDLTSSNFNIGFEAGYAMALGKPIIFTCNQKWKNDQPDKNFPFDIQNYPVIIYDIDSDKNCNEFRERLKASIQLALALNSRAKDFPYLSPALMSDLDLTL